MTHRAAFIASSDYLGPDRRARDRGASLGRVGVPNSILQKTTERLKNSPALNGLVAGTIHELLSARMASHGYRIGLLCQAFAHSQDRSSVLAALIWVLGEAGALAVQLKDPLAALVCSYFRDELISLRAAAPQAELDLIARAVVPCLRPSIPRQTLAAEAEQGARTFLSRPRAGLDAATLPALTGGSLRDIGIVQLSPGEALFRQGDVAGAAYIVLTGTVALYRQREGQQVPVANLHRGETYGEMAVADGTPRRASAIATQDSIVIAVPRASLDRALAAADPAVQTFARHLANSLRAVHEVYGPKSRHISESVQQMVEQVESIVGYIASPSAPAGLSAEGGAAAAKIGALTAELIDLIAAHPELDRRSRALPEADT